MDLNQLDVQSREFIAHKNWAPGYDANKVNSIPFERSSKELDQSL